MSKYTWGILSALLGLIGTILIYYSFQAASTPFLLVVNREGKAYICVGTRALFSMEQNGALVMGTGCGDTTDARPAAVVNIEHQSWGHIGFFLLLSSFALQGYSLEKPKPIIEPRQSFGPRQKSPNKAN